MRGTEETQEVSNPDGDPLVAILASGPSIGMLLYYPEGSFIYAPGNLCSGEDSFIELVSDGSGESNLITVMIRSSLVSSPTCYGSESIELSATPTP